MVTTWQASAISMAGASPDDIVVRIDGTRPLSPELALSITAACDAAESQGKFRRVIVQVAGTPRTATFPDVTVGLVSRWERALRRLERLAAVTIAVADGDCGGPALDALLVTDYRIAAPTLRLLVPGRPCATWPGMALYRLAQQVGVAAARRAALFGEPVGATEALALRLVDEVTKDLAGALAATARLAGGSPGAELAIRRQLILEAPAISFEDALGTHLAACDRALREAAGERPR